MAKPPVYQQTESRRPIMQQGVTVRATPDDFGAGVGAAVQGLGRVGQGVGEALAAVKGMEDEASAKQADNALAEWDRQAKYDPTSGYLNRQGEAAVAGQASYEESFKSKRTEIAQGLTPGARQLFDGAAQARQNSSFQSAIIHAGKERQAWFKNASSSRQDMFANEAATQYKDTSAVNKNIAAGVAEIQSFGQQEGLDGETIKLKSEAYESLVRRNVILRMAEDDPLGAQAELDRTKDRLTGADQHDLGKALKVGVAEAKAKQQSIAIRQEATGAQNNTRRFANPNLPAPAYALLGVISGTESPDYNVLNGGERFDNYADHPRRVGKGGTATAAGKYQFVQGTWDRVAKANGFADFSPANQDAGGWWLAQADYKSRTGRDLTSDINNGDFAAVRRGLAPTWEGLQFLSDDQFAARMTGASRGGVAIDANLMNARVNSIQDPDERARVQRYLAGDLAAQKQQYEGYSDSIGLKVLQHQVTSESEILDDPVLDTGDKIKHLRAYRDEMGKAIDTAASMAAFSSGTFAPDPYDDKGRKAADDLFDNIKTNVTPDRVLPAAEEITRQSGIVPKPVVNALRAASESQNGQEVAQALQQASRFSQINPAALSRRDGGSQLQGRVDDFDYMVNNLNMSPQEAGQKIAEKNNPERQRDRKILEPVAKEFLKQIDNEDLGAMFDESVLPFNDPQVGFTDTQALGIKADYKAIAEEQFYSANGDVDLAKNRAKQEMQRIYGVTNLTGSRVVMKYPPEKFWPGKTPDGVWEGIAGDPFSYVRDQLSRDISSIDSNFAKDLTIYGANADNPVGAFDMSKVQFVATSETDKMIKRGEMPAYQVMYTDSNGVLQTIPGKLWKPDMAAVDAENKARVEEQNRQAITRGREEQPDEMKRARLANEDDGGRAAAQDAFINQTLPMDEVGN